MEHRPKVVIIRQLRCSSEDDEPAKGHGDYGDRVLNEYCYAEETLSF